MLGWMFQENVTPFPPHQTFFSLLNHAMATMVGGGGDVYISSSRREQKNVCTTASMLGIKFRRIVPSDEMFYYKQYFVSFF